MLPSPISRIKLDGRNFYVKRDDLIDPFLAGNKYRKLYALLETPKEKYTRIVSYGGTQSNAMLAIAAMCKIKSWEFIYYTKPVSRAVYNAPNGNFGQAIKLGMLHKEISLEYYKDFISSLRVQNDEKTFLLDQGGADSLAKHGIEVLAQEIRESDLKLRSLAIPSGTGTSALYLALSLPEYQVYTTPSVGDAKYLREQMSVLECIPENLNILIPSKKYHFAKVYPEFFAMHNKLLSTGIEFDLLYAPLMWKTLLEKVEEECLYIHSGGVSGNSSMLQRYEKKGLTINADTPVTKA